MFSKLNNFCDFQNLFISGTEFYTKKKSKNNDSVLVIGILALFSASKLP